MSNPYFKFKQFTVFQDKCAMKVGTDGVLLGAWTFAETAKKILDIGTGTGLAALMLAQRSEAFITALEIDSDAVCQARENVNRSPWSDRIEVVQADFNRYLTEEKYDVVVSNPPYFEASLKSTDLQRSIARHDCQLSGVDLFRGVRRVLSPQGSFTLIIPTDAADRIKSIAQDFGLFPSRRLEVITKPGGLPKRTLFAFTLTEQVCTEEVLLTETARHQYSKEYIELTKEFYLKF